MMAKVALLFPGQGAQYPRMAAGLYGHSAPFTATMDRAFAALGPGGDGLRGEWLSGAPAELFDDVTRAQPLLYAVDCALGEVVLDWGVEPVALLGHSVGEMAAATLAGVFGLDEGMRLMRDRTEHYARTEPGGMLAVAASAADLAPHLVGRVTVAAVNAPRQTLVAGPRAELDEVARTLRDKGFTCRDVRARQGFHSPVVDGAVESSAAAWRSVDLRRPRRTVYSSQLGAELSPEHAVDPLFWARQPAATVWFWQALRSMLDEDGLVLLEAGPGQGLSSIARRHPSVRSGRNRVVPLSPPRPGPPEADREAVRRAADRIGPPR
ncbi:acyltransferase domain-containing protein [Actinomadura gamaensis]|uniref:Acyltransferase domain-containing protein n=1 Tax=Actinomadura gamaensis TaxID=1763541 RepID=A0ABV9U3G5_9ACTN